MENQEDPVIDTGFASLTGAASFDSLQVIDKYAGAGGDLNGNELFIIFRVRDKDNKPLLISSSLIEQAVSKEYIIIMNYVGTGSYSVDLLKTNPSGADFILKEAYNYNESKYHVIHLIKGKLASHSAFSVTVQMDTNIFHSTALITDAESRHISPSFAIF
ncbi:hypothetical protein [Serratia ficaria]|uniref:hypothetical protein n=1 Tax=Serratia ficaria TaxID=61651 RepID=UPI00077C9081|nr:hypothetical protein [Serratia ficaria]CAI1891315.1 Uncharacterised protein [Serratia ficaria]